ncbi:SigE family RNA polymerase sigma factor [Streptomyces sp. So13.3]|uniref:SigE family RNA polymerase sigma factor n=2 Tax=Streptomyces TaxID=1883 RepID=UPI0018DF7DBE|nr:SigE family RNA polymerase sigma factor [Streptomyces sp. So13.3]
MRPMEGSFEEYVQARGPALLRLAFLLCSDRHLAEDLTQDVLIRVYRQWRRISGLGHPDAYVKRMLVNEHLSWRRRRSNGELPTAEMSSPAEQGDAADTVVRRHAAVHLLAGLPKRQRAVLVLRFYEDLTDQQIAEVLRCSPATVRSQASRALATLRTSRGLTRQDV